MKQASRKIDAERVQFATHFSRQSLESWLRNAERAWLDYDREEREKVQQCRYCYYARESRIGGCALTDKDCDHCGETQHYGSTATDPLCLPCAAKLKLCIRCCADITLANRRKLEFTVRQKRGLK